MYLTTVVCQNVDVYHLFTHMIENESEMNDEQYESRAK
jgi:hypothetical protein